MMRSLQRATTVKGFRILPKAALLLALSVPSTFALAQAPAFRSVRVDDQGVIRWTDDGSEVTLLGTNYSPMSAHDYMSVGFFTQDRKKAIDQDLEQFARMGFRVVRLATWADWESSDEQGNLVQNDHVDLMDYLIAEGRKRGIYFLLTPMHTYRPSIPKEQTDELRGFEHFYKKSELGTNPKAIAAQANFLKQTMEHVNPYTHTALKDEPSILFVELINEPVHHAEDIPGSVRYINALADAVRGTGCQKILFFNLMQDTAIAPAILASHVQGITAAWYPTSLLYGRNMPGNYLRTVDAYTPLKDPALAKLPRIVYEFDSASLVEPYMYPAMARAYREVGVQSMTMFTYDSLVGAATNVEWATHNLNMVYTPGKAVSAVIAAQVMERTPRGKSYGSYPGNRSFGPFRVSYEQDLSEMNAPDKFMYSNSTPDAPVQAAALKQVVGHGSSSTVTYPGQGIYFLDKISDSMWRLELYPDSVMVSDPFTHPSKDEIKWRLVDHPWPMSVTLPGLGDSFRVQALNEGNTYSTRAKGKQFVAKPGVYLLSRSANPNLAALPETIGQVGMREYVCPPPPRMPAQILLTPDGQYVAGKEARVTASFISPESPASLTLKVRRGSAVKEYAMKPVGGYSYTAVLPPAAMTEGEVEFAVEGASARLPAGDGFLKSQVVGAKQTLTLFDPATDRQRLSFTRVSDDVREPQMTMETGAEGGSGLKLRLPLKTDPNFEDYSLSSIINDRIVDRHFGGSQGKSLTFRARAGAGHKDGYLTLVEIDGTGWTTKLDLTDEWKQYTVALDDLKVSRSVKLPHGYPGMWWLYWCDPAEGRGGAGDHVKLGNVERLQFSQRQVVDPSNKTPAQDDPWIELGPVELTSK